VTVGGITAGKQAVEVAKMVSSSFVSNDALDGLLGLSFSSLNSQAKAAVDLLGQCEATVGLAARGC
jgi:hypothetical protein